MGVLGDESLPPPASEPGGREASVGTGGALFLARNPPSNAPLLFPSGRPSHPPTPLILCPLFSPYRVWSYHHSLVFSFRKAIL